MRQAEIIAKPEIFQPHLSALEFIGPCVISFADGEVWLVMHWGTSPTKFTASSERVDQPKVLRSQDGGRTWGNAFYLPMDWNLHGACNAGGCSLLRLHSGRLIFTAHRESPLFHRSGSHGVPIISLSDDDGLTWSPPRLMLEKDDIYYVMNQRLIEMDSGRLLLPVSARDPRVSIENYGEGKHPCLSACLISDDSGLTWHMSAESVREPTERGAQEPCVAQIGPNRVLMLYRSGKGCHQMSISEDGGETWSDPRDTALTAACSPLTLTTLPDGRLFLLYNHAPPLFEESYYPRNPLTYAVSMDGGQTWSEPRLIDDQTGQQLIYPTAAPTREGLVIVYSAHYDVGDGSFSFPADAWKTGGGKSCVIAYPE